MRYSYVQKVEVFWQFQFSVEFCLWTCCHLLNRSLISCILVAQICCTSPTPRLSWSLAGTYSPTAPTLVPDRLDALEWHSGWTCLFRLDLRQSVGGESSKWLPMRGKHNDLHLLLRCVMVFSILLALPSVGIDFVHEFGNREDLIIPCCTDLQAATQVSRVQVGEDSLCN